MKKIRSRKLSISSNTIRDLTRPESVVGAGRCSSEHSGVGNCTVSVTCVTK